MHNIKSVGIWSFGKAMGAAGFVLGAIFSIFYATMALGFGMLIGFSGEDGSGGAAALSVVGAILILVVLPIGYGIASLIIGLIYGMIINVVLWMCGGVEIELAPVKR